MLWTTKTVKCLALVVPAFLLVGCAGGGDGEASGSEESSSPSPSASESPRPDLGGIRTQVAKPPDEPMDQLEEAVLAQLKTKVVGQGLTLAYLDCPKWDGKAPHQMTCKGYLNGVTADVRVRLTRTTTSVNFDAELQDGVLATANLVEQLKAKGYAAIDCGDVPAYPTVVGNELVCSVGKGTTAKYVVATVLDGVGTVEIRDY